MLTRKRVRFGSQGINRGRSAPRSGQVAGIDAMDVGLTGALLGGGRARKGEPIDHSVGVMLHAKVGDEVARGEPLCS